MTLGEKLKQLRLEFRYSQKLVEERTGINRTTISAYELDKRTPSVENLSTLARLYRADLNYLCDLSHRRLIDTTGLPDIVYLQILNLIKSYDNFYE